VAIAMFALVAAGSGAGAIPQPDEPLVTSVTPSIDHSCPSGGGLSTVWGYTNSSASTVTITKALNADDPMPNGDGDNDDNFFFPLPNDRGQTTSFAPGTSHNVITTTSAATDNLVWTLGTNHSPPVSGPINCADVQVTKTQLLDSLTAGQQEQYTVTATNAGPTAATGVAVSDTLPAGVTGVSATSGQTSCTVASGTVSCAAVANLAVNSSVTVTITVTLPSTGTFTDTASATTTSFDPNTANNTASVNTPVSAVGGPQGGGILNQGQQLTVNSGTTTGTSGTIKVQNGTVPLTIAIKPQSQCPVGATCKSDLLDIEPHAVPAGQTLTETFDSGRPSPFVPILFVKFFVFKNGVDKPLPFCRPYLKPQPLPDGSSCEYFRYMTLQGHAVVLIALGADDPVHHR
jgi:uncharacterized repeat protein (TIGR01451 family)